MRSDFARKMSAKLTKIARQVSASVDLNCTNIEVFMLQLLMKGGKPLIGEVSINGAKNAAIFAAQILAVGDAELAGKMKAYRQKLADEVAVKSARVAAQV